MTQLSVTQLSITQSNVIGARLSRRFAIVLVSVVMANLGWMNLTFAEDSGASVAVRSKYTRTASEAELAAILQAAESSDDRIQLHSIGQSHEGRPIQGLKIGFDVDDGSGDEATDAERLTVLIIGGIHSGECAGKEALCELVGHIVDGQHETWFSSLRLLIVPSLSPDSNNRRAVDNRPGQVGPSQGMGRRANAQGLDLNRDFIKLESPEISALVRAINEFDVDLLIDLHTTNGSQHRFDLTYDPPHHPLTPEPIRQFLRDDLLPSITQDSADDGYPFFYYGNFDRARTRWSTYGYEPRYSTNYIGVRGKLGLLSEAYSYASYQRRIESSGKLVVETLDYLTEHASLAASLCQTGRPIASGESLAVTAKLTAFSDPITIPSYEADASNPDGRPATADAKPKDYMVAFEGNFVPKQTVNAPLAYFVPANQTGVMTLLAKHGIRVETEPPIDGGIIESFGITDCQIADEAFQGHRMVTLGGQWSADETSADDSTKPRVVSGRWVPMDQPLAALAAIILEPMSSDSVATWNVIPAAELSSASRYPILRLQPGS